MKTRQWRGLTGLAMILIFWQVLSMLFSQRVFPGPLSTVRFFIDQPNSGLIRHIGVSLYRIGAALFGSLLIGLPLGLLSGRNRHLDAIFSPPVYILYPLPKIAFLPVLMILFGLGDVSKIALIVLVIVLQVFITVRDSVGRIPKEYFVSAASLGLSKGNLYRHLILPAILPSLFSALRVSLGISFSVLFFAENYATRWGIGFFIMDAWSMIDYQRMFAGILTLGLTGFLLYKLIDLAEAFFCSGRYRLGSDK